jgi:hypothetical protein
MQQQKNKNNECLCEGKGLAVTCHEGTEEYRCISSHSYLGDRWGWVVNSMSPQLYPLEGAPIPIVQEVGWAPVSIWKGTENLAPT